MKYTLCIIVVFLSNPILSQSKKNTEPLILRGQLTNCPENELIISFRDKNEQVSYDTIKLDEEGRFFLKTYKIKEPQKANIQKNRIQINNLFLAPGYVLSLNGNGKDFLSLVNTLKITGTGAESNVFRRTLDSILINDKTHVAFYKLNINDLLSYIQYEKKLRDSVFLIAFDKLSKKDKYHAYFRKVVELDNIFRQLNLLIANINFNYRYAGSELLLKKHFNNAILNDLYKDAYLISDEYRNVVILSPWSEYLINMDFLKDSNLRSIADYKYRKINEVYKGKVKELAIYGKLEYEVFTSKTLQDLNELNEKIDAFLSQPYNPILKKSIEAFFSEQKTALERTMTGEPAPGFALKTIAGKEYNLSDFKGKVVYIDIWASWCTACREQNPSLKLLYEKYKNDDRIVIIGIDVRDGYNDWKKAMEHDKPTWLQLKDEDDMVWNSYIAYGLPKFIVIDKLGKIVESNAPWPESGNEIETLLNRELEK